MCKKLSILAVVHNYYNYLTATVVQGFKNLGHKVYSFEGHEANYCEPWLGQEYDFVLQAWGNKHSFCHDDKPRIFVSGDDTGIDRQPSHAINFADIDADLYFIRDLRDASYPKCFPLNFGIEDRYYCSTKDGIIPMEDREVDVIFLGQYDNCAHRRKLLDETATLLSLSGHSVVFGGRAYNATDDYWSKWVNGHCGHDPRYFEALANAKVIFSPMGFGPDCARHWEAFASGGIPCIQFMPTVMTPPIMRDGLNCITFKDAKEAAIRISEVLSDPDRAQIMANMAFEFGKTYHITAQRAKYILQVMSSTGVLENC